LHFVWVSETCESHEEVLLASTRCARAADLHRSICAAETAKD
jgi:hypothetical protein